MNSIDQKDGCWPTEQQELLLKAALQKGSDSIQSWEKWIDSADINTLDAGSQRLLPLLMMNLRSQGISHPILNKFKGVYRQTWYRNQMLFHEIIPVICSFQQAGIETMILKGAALVADYYKDPGLRPMEDFDLLVPVSKIIPAINLLRDLHWNPKNRLEVNNPEQKAFHFVNRTGYNLDLHCHIMFETSQQDADQDFWEAAIPTRIGDVSTLALNPTDQLLHTFVHGFKSNPLPSLRWVADTLIIFSVNPVVDWERLIFQSKKNEVALIMKEALEYVACRMNAPIPPEVLDCVQCITISHHDRVRYLLMTVSLREYKRARVFNDSYRGLGSLPLYWYLYTHHFASTSGWLPGLLGFPRFLQHQWKLKPLLLVPFYIIGKGVRQLWNRLFGYQID